MFDRELVLSIGRLAQIKHESWLRDFRQLQKQIHASGGFGLGEMKEEVMTNLRKIRQQVFENLKRTVP